MTATPRVHEPLTETVLQDGFFAGELGDPWAHLAELRAKAPVSWNERGGYWVATQHAPVQQGSVNPERFCSKRGILVYEIGQTWDAPSTMMHTDPPEHTRYRQLIAPAFRPSRMRALEDRIRGHVSRLLDQIEPGAPVDIVEALNVPLPLLVICELLGVPWADWERFFEFSEVSIPGALDISEEERQAIRTSMIGYLREAVQSKAGTGAEDVFGMLSDAGLSNEEIRMFAVQLLVAGNETVRNTLTAGLGAFADHPEQWQRLRADRSLLGSAIEEVLRWATPVIYFMRTAVDDTEFFGAEIAAGDPVVMLYSSADRDEHAFGPTAGEFDIGRSPNPHVAFGFGAHYCVGAALARQEIAAVLDGMLDRYASIERAAAPVYSRSSIIHGTKRAELVLTPA
jgi:cytochrome P450